MNRQKREEYERTQITLVRHTAVAPEWQVACYGNIDTPLTTTLEEEAPRVAAQIDLSLYDHILPSPLFRMLQLVRYCVSEGIHIKVGGRLKEMNFGDWEGQPRTSILKTGQEVSAFFECFVGRPAPRGESLRDLTQRVADLPNELYGPDAQRVFLLSYDGVINAVRPTARCITLQEVSAQTLPYGSVTTIELDDLIYIDQIRL